MGRNSFFFLKNDQKYDNRTVNRALILKLILYRGPEGQYRLQLTQNMSLNDKDPPYPFFFSFF